jgi:hypothetical protein
LGWFGNDPEFDILEILGVRDYVDCVQGSGSACKSAALDAGIAAATAAVGKGLKVAFKAVKAGMKRGDTVSIDDIVQGACRVPHSFVPGTEVLMADGTTKPIEDVEVGDEIIATDPETGEQQKRSVVATITTEDDKDFVNLTVDTNEGSGVLVATTTHPFWVEKHSAWVDAGDLVAGMELQAPDGSTAFVKTVQNFTKLQRTHDLTINDVHTYYVLAGETPVLVHNSNGCILPTPSVSDPKLQNLVNDLYKGTTNPARTGDGTTMSAIRDELSSGQLVHGRNHVAKGNQYAKALNKWIGRNHRDGDPHDLIVARSLLADLKSALAGN